MYICKLIWQYIRNLKCLSSSRNIRFNDRSKLSLYRYMILVIALIPSSLNLLQLFKTVPSAPMMMTTTVFFLNHHLFFRFLGYFRYFPVSIDFCLWSAWSTIWTRWQEFHFMFLSAGCSLGNYRGVLDKGSKY